MLKYYQFQIKQFLLKVAKSFYVLANVLIYMSLVKYLLMVNHYVFLQEHLINRSVQDGSKYQEEMIINIKLVKISLQLSVEGNPWLLWFCFLCSVIQKTCSTFSTNQIQNLKLIVIQSFAILCKNENLTLGEDNFFLISLSFLITYLLDDLWLLWGLSYMLITSGSLRVEQPSTIF